MSQYTKAYRLEWNDFEDDVTIQATFWPKSAILLNTGVTINYYDWVKIDYNSGANSHYFLDLGSSGFYDALIQPTPPPYPTTYSSSDLQFVAGGPADFATYIVANYANWINGIQYPGFQVAISGITSAITQTVVTTIIPLTPGPVVMNITFIDNDETKDNAIRAKKAVFQFLSNTETDFSTFAFGEDDQWYVTVYNLDSGGNEDELIFNGFLVMDDSQSAFLPNPVIVELTATDNIGRLKTVPLLDTSTNKNPKGVFSLATYFRWALAPTGLNLPMNFVCSLTPVYSGSSTTYAVTTQTSFVANQQQFYVPLAASNDFFTLGRKILVTDTALNNKLLTITGRLFNITNIVITVAETLSDELNVQATFTDAGIFENCYLDAKTYETEIDVSEDCYTVLEKISKAFNCFLSQHDGEWWIESFDELRFDYKRVFHYSSDGILEWIDQTSADYTKNIGRGLDIYPRDAAGIVQIRRPQKSYSRKYLFQIPKEIPCNSDFSRGDILYNLGTERYNTEGNLITNPNDFASTDIIYNVSGYTIDCWTYVKEPYNPDTLTNPPDQTPYIKKYYLNDTEEQRFTVIPVDNDDQSLFSEPFRVSLNDKINLSIDFRGFYQLLDIPSGTFKDYYNVWLDADDGTNWTLGMEGKWYQSDASWSTNIVGIQIPFTNRPFDETKFNAVPVKSQPCPRSGKIYIGINNSAVEDIDFNNFSLEYLPFSNGSYQKFSGIQGTFSQDLNLKDSTEEQIYICDGLKYQFKGALLTYNSIDYVLANQFYSVLDGAVNGFKIDTFLKFTTNQLWNQFKNSWRVFNFNLQGLQTNQCARYRLINRITDQVFTYVDCDTGEVVSQTIYANEIPVYICARRGSLEISGVEVTEQTSCDSVHVPDLTHRYFIQDADYQSTNRIFEIVAMQEQNFKELKWQVTLGEVYSIENGYVYGNNGWVFKYLT